LVKLVRISAGDHISKSDPLVVLEAMKMEHTLIAERDGIVESIFVKEGEQVTGGTILLTLQPESTIE
jgi:3-methylcrotonyl-CoA carboxylase alpha subunit